MTMSQAPGEIAPNGKPVESVWDFPRPPRSERVEWRIRVVHQGVAVVDAPWAMRVLETSQAPAYYVAPEFVDLSLLQMSERRSMCEWKGIAHYADLVGGDGAVVTDVAWCYEQPTQPFTAIAGYWAFYAQKVDGCFVDDEHVIPNEGSFYGGWVTTNVIGPIKGAPGTTHW
jgi:uncharacterized protein (DUF427 family)